VTEYGGLFVEALLFALAFKVLDALTQEARAVAIGAAGGVVIGVFVSALLRRKRA
jgi:hypothetical protein